MGFSLRLMLITGIVKIRIANQFKFLWISNETAKPPQLLGGFVLFWLQFAGWSFAGCFIDDPLGQLVEV